MQSVNEVGLVNVPEPLDVHAILECPIELDPEVILIAPDVLQVNKVGPATGVGDENIVNTLVAVTEPQYKLLTVNVKVRGPPAISAALGS